MWKQLVTIGAFAVALAATPALAQQEPSQDPMQPPAASEPPAESGAAPGAEQAAPMGDLTGLDVYSSDGQKIGTVVKANLDADGKAESLHVDIGGFLGIGQKTVEISAEEFTEADGRIELTLTADAASDLPEVQAE